MRCILYGGLNERVLFSSSLLDEDNQFPIVQNSKSSELVGERYSKVYAA